MREVLIAFSNIQSHEYTEFSLKPGLNFILAEDNNVGKSTIFKVLTTIAKAPSNGGSKIDSLIRTGTSTAYASFTYDGERVVAWLYRGQTPGASKMFFEYSDASGVASRHLECPESLLDALGIVRGSNNDIINFNDADSVQLISKNSVESDAIIAKVMEDRRIEMVKTNVYRLSTEMTNDDHSVSARCDTAEHLLSEMCYVETVDEFNDSYEELEALCKLCDAIPPIETPKGVSCAEGDIFEMKALLHLCQCVEGAQRLSGEVKSLTADEEVQANLLKGLSSVDFSALYTKIPPASDIDRLKAEVNSVAVLRNASIGCRAIAHLNATINMQEAALRGLHSDLRKYTKDVVCPIKGRVYYTDEKCISNNS